MGAFQDQFLDVFSLQNVDVPPKILSHYAKRSGSNYFRSMLLLFICICPKKNANQLPLPPRFSSGFPTIPRLQDDPFFLELTVFETLCFASRLSGQSFAAARLEANHDVDQIFADEERKEKRSGSSHPFGSISLNLIKLFLGQLFVVFFSNRHQVFVSIVLLSQADSLLQRVGLAAASSR